MQILHNGHIYTQDANNPYVTAIAIENNYIRAIGTDIDILSLSVPNSQVIDLFGKTIWPGLTDAHIHLENYAYSLLWVDCETETREKCLKQVEEQAKQSPGGVWVIGHGWNQNSWTEGFGDARQLDLISFGHPIYLTAKSLHAAWANSLALQQAGINALTIDPPGGKIVRDSEGQPTGILFEAAMGLVEKAIPVRPQAQICQLILGAQTKLIQMGITGLHDYDPHSCFSALQELNRQNNLKLRVIKGIPLEDMPHAIGLGIHSGFGDNFLRIGSVKLFADGALGPRTAAMIDPYENEADYTGYSLLDAEQIFEVGSEAVLNGLSLAVHAIGDGANHAVLDAYAHLRAFENEQHLLHARHRIEHVQILHPDDFDRLGKLGIVASMQPVHATSDMLMADKHWGKRSANAYAWNTLLNNNTNLAFGSDAPVESPNPFWGLHAAVTRQRINGKPGPSGWYPDQRITLEQALHAYTYGPAFAAGLEKKLGKLLPGYFADMNILEENPFFISPQDLYQVKPIATIIGGEWVWQNYNFKGNV